MAVLSSSVQATLDTLLRANLVISFDLSPNQDTLLLLQEFCSESGLCEVVLKAWQDAPAVVLLSKTLAKTSVCRARQELQVLARHCPLPVLAYTITAPHWDVDEQLVLRWESHWKLDTQTKMQTLHFLSDINKARLCYTARHDAEQLIESQKRAGLFELYMTQQQVASKDKAKSRWKETSKMMRNASVPIHEYAREAVLAEHYYDWSVVDSQPSSPARSTKPQVADAHERCGPRCVL
ncbi:hypothetical protein HDV03_003464 [Kappamyces sp. JEL0829]|nr:hypothetical protein HDV03_003464 [Kappamyces sp. JEL0829]